MFKHLTRIAARNRGGAVSAGPTQLTARTLFHTQSRFALMAQCQNNLFASMSARHFSATAQRRDLSALVPDYTVPEYFQDDLRKNEFTTAQVREKHPADMIAQPMRKRLDYLSQIGKNEALLFNLPQSATKEQIEGLVRETKGVQLMGLSITQSLQEDKLAFAYIKVASPAQIKLLREKFRNTWLDDKKLKFKGQEELGYETFDHRTLIAQNIPSHFKRSNLVELFSRFGAVVSVELPTKNAAIEDEIKGKLTKIVKERREKEALDIRRAQAVIQESVRENEFYYREALTKALGSQEAADSVILQLGGAQPFEEGSAAEQVTQQLNRQRQLSIQQMLFQLQSESAEVSKARKVLLSLRDTASEEPTSGLGERDFEAVQQQIIENKEVLKNSIAYIRKNRENINEQTLERLNEQLLLEETGSTVDPIQQLIALSQQELAQAYDGLIGALNSREDLIEARIRSQIDHLGVEERILFEKKDWGKELEDIGNFDNAFGESGGVAEHYIPVNEQITNVLEDRNMTAQDRFVKVVTGSLNPFLERNFNKDQLAYSESPHLDSEIRIPKKPIDINKAPTINRELFEGYLYTAGSLEGIQKQIEELRDQFDLPFDELYQKEKKLVDAVIKATEALRKKEALLPSPINEDRYFDVNELKGTYLGDEYQKESRFVRDQRKRQSKLLSQQIDQEGSTAFNFNINETQSFLDKQLEDGTLSRKEYDEFVRWHKEMTEVNLGYAFVTFSHADEAKLALIVGNGMEADRVELELCIKRPDIDHKDFDASYSINKQRNEARLTEELKGLREARKELRDFEANIDKDLPSMKKLKKFRGMAKDLIGERTHTGGLIGRTEREEQAVLDKIRLLQKQHPERDYTQLFETERAEQARKDQHKKAFASYKAFQFLKHGVELQSRGAPVKQEKEKPAPYKVNDPYDFPELNQYVAMQMPKGDLYPKVIDSWDTIQGNGRRFGYTNDDFLQAYFGKDYARAPEFLADDSNLFSVNETLNRRFPMDKYLVGPQIEAKKALLEQRAGMENPEFDQVVESFDTVYNMRYEDTPHPTDANRSLIKDAQKRMDGYMRRKEKQSIENEIEGTLWSIRDVAGMKKALRDEYFPRPVKKEIPDTKDEEKFEPYFEGEQENRPSSAESDQEEAEEYYESDDNNEVNPLLKDMDQDPLLSPQQTTLSDDAYVNKDLSELNSEFIYDQKYRRERGIETEVKSVQQQRFERTAALNDDEGEVEDFLEGIKDQTRVADETYRLGRDYSDRNRFGLSQTEFDSKPREKQVRSITDFAQNDEDLSEREDEDLYRHYMEQMRREKQADNTLPKDLNERLVQQKLKDLESLHPEMPRFEGYLRSLQAKESPFETEKPDEYDIGAEEKYDEELYKRELQGRLIGETLSPKQFALLYNVSLDKNAQIAFQKDKDRRQFIDNRDLVRLQDEQMESARRFKVKQGDWTEEESHAKVREIVAKEAQRQLEEVREHEQELRHQREYKRFMELIMGDEEGQKTAMEKEYYFDEGLGESLKEHVEDLKKRFPEIDVTVRRDREGYPIVKTKYAPKYKYDIEKAIEFNADEAKQRIDQSIEDLHENVLGIKKGGDINHSDLQAKLAASLQTKEQHYDYDAASKERFQDLWKERIAGIYVNDRAGFTKAYLEATKKATFDTSKPASPFAQPEDAASTYLNVIAKDREQIQVEIMMQASSRIKHHLLLKERKASDIVQARRSETSLFQKQVQSHGNAMQDLENAAGMMEKQESFDQEAYQRVKAEIKQRREAKERLLQQGFPELKPYISI